MLHRLRCLKPGDSPPCPESAGSGSAVPGSETNRTGKGIGTAAGLVVILLSVMISAPAMALDRSARAKENLQRIAEWNAFADSLYRLHLHRLEGRRVTTREERGGYGGSTGVSDYYRSVEYRDADSGILLSRIQWETDYPFAIHVIQVFVHDEADRLVRDYVAAYLPRFRNAPIQTLINFHNVGEDLRAFRQFDASGARIYEQCEGRYLDREVSLSLEEHEIPTSSEALVDEEFAESYVACFGDLPITPGRYRDPGSEAPELGRGFGTTVTDWPLHRADIEERVRAYTAAIAASPSDPRLYVERGDAYFLLRRFDMAERDFTRAIALDNGMDAAYFGRGMARGRLGLLDEAIADLSVFIERHPDSSIAHAKRGVRYLWRGDMGNAEKDMVRAIALDAENAEAHDDLGVIHARRDEHDRAIGYFQSAIRIDPKYQKAYHNLAMVYYITGKVQRALLVVDDGLALRPDDRESLLLKGEILLSLGRRDEALAVRERAEFLPRADWSERLPVR